MYFLSTSEYKNKQNFNTEKNSSCEISGYHSSEYEDDSLLGYSAM
jgi:hypothetical protein